MTGWWQLKQVNTHSWTTQTCHYCTVSVITSSGVVLRRHHADSCHAGCWLLLAGLANRDRGYIWVKFIIIYTIVDAASLSTHRHLAQDFVNGTCYNLDAVPCYYCVITWTWNPKTDWTGLTMTKTVCHRLTDSQDRTNNQQLHKHSWLYTKTINVGKQTKPKSKLLLLSLWLCHRLDAGFCLCFDLGVARTWSQSQTLPWCLQFTHGFLRKSES